MPRGQTERGLLTRSAMLHRNCSSSRKSSHTRACGQDFPSREAPHAGPAKPRLGLNKSNRRKETAGFQKSSSAAIIAGDPGAGGVHKRDEQPLQRGQSGGTARWDRRTEGGAVTGPAFTWALEPSPTLRTDARSVAPRGGAACLRLQISRAAHLCHQHGL